jgi:haloalkane dehalogenase
VDRRRFIQRGGGIAATTMLAGCARHGVRSLASTSMNNLPNNLTAFEYHETRRYAVTPFGRIAYVERGYGPTALFLHGFPLNSFQWRSVIPRLAGHRRCIAPDFLGLGFSEVAERQSLAADAQAKMLATLLDKLAVSAVDLIANDSGGAAAQLFVTQHPERVRTMLLTNCDVEPDSPPPALLPVIKLARAQRFADEWLVPWLADKALARSDKGIGGMCYADRQHPTDEAIDYYLGPLLSSPSRKQLTNAYAAALDPNPLAGLAPKLKHCPVPTRIVWGTGDNIFSQASPDYLDSLLPNSRGVRRVPGAKLFFPEEMSGLIAEEVMQLWKI